MVTRTFAQLRLLTLYLRRFRRYAELRNVRDIRDAFDVEFYLAMNTDVALAGLDPILHYLRYGWREKRDPTPEFSTVYYLEQNADIRAWGVNPFVHYQRYGRREGRLPKGRPLTWRDNAPRYRDPFHEAAIFEHFGGRMREPGLKTPVFDFPCVLLAFTNRSGSNLLSDYMGQTGVFLEAQEFLDAEFVIRSEKELGIEWFSQFFAGVQRHDIGDSGKLFVFKASWGQIAMLARWGILDMHRTVKVIHIRRRDLVGQAVSMAIAEQTESWSSEMRQKREPRFEFAPIRHHLFYTTFCNGTIESLCNVLGFDRIEVFYEDLVADPKAVVRDIGAFFGKDLSGWEPCEPRLKKQSGATNERFRALFVDEFKARFGFDGAGGRDMG